MANVSKIGTGTGDDYATLVAWEADTDNDLVTAAAGEDAEMQESITESSGLIVAGATTDATYYRAIYPKAGSAWNDSGDTAIYEGMTGIYSSQTANYANYDFSELYFRTYKMIYKKSGSGVAYTNNPASGTKINKTYDCILHNSSTATGNMWTFFGSGADVWNCYFSGDSASSKQVYIGGSASCTNCLVLQTDTAAAITEIHTFTGGPIKNTAYDGNWSSTTGFAAGTDYNSSSGTTVPGANSIQSTVMADAITSVTADWRAVSGQALDGAGLTVSGYETDCFGNTRSGACTIGPYEIQAAAGGGRKNPLGWPLYGPMMGPMGA